MLLAGITAFLANKHIAVFNDGVRPLVGQARQGNLKYKALAGMSFAMSIGYVVGFIPFSLVSNILILHTVLLGSEMIGLVIKKGKMQSIIAGVIAMAFGAALFWGLSGLNVAITKTTYQGFGFDLGMIVDGAFPFIFSMFPAIAVFIQSGWKRGLVTILVAVTTYILVSLFGWNQAHLYPMAITLLVGSAMLFGFALWDYFSAKRKSSKEETQDKKEIVKSRKFAMFNDNAAVIAKNKWYLVISGAIASMVVASFASAPLVSMALQTTTNKAGDITSAIIADTTWVIGFIPLVVLTALLTGVYSPVGVTAVFVWGDLAKIIGASIVAKTNNQNMYFIAIALAGVFGGVSMFAETYLLKSIAVLLTRVPGIQKISDSMRSAITKTINYAFLIGGIIAAFIMGQHVGAHISGSSTAMAGLAFWLPSMGAGIVILLLIINKISKKKMADIAIGPMGAIIVGILFNIIYFIA